MQQFCAILGNFYDLLSYLPTNTPFLLTEKSHFFHMNSHRPGISGKGAKSKVTHNVTWEACRVFIVCFFFGSAAVEMAFT